MFLSLIRAYLNIYNLLERKLTIVLIIFYLASFNIKAQDEGGYANKFSFQPGDSIEFHISTSLPLFDINILKLDAKKVLIGSINSINGGLRITKDSASILGCNWPTSISIKIPKTWQQGVYLAEFPTSSGYKDIIFRVASDLPGKYSKIVISLPVNTWQAYNSFGGYNFYRTKTSLSTEAHQLSWDRPFYKDHGEDGSGQYYRWADHLVKWLVKEKFPFEFTDNVSLYNDPNILSNYKVLVLVGHDEYMSRPERLQIERFVKNGGKVIILSGNTCWLQIRYGNNQKEIYCYRRFQLDPYYKKADSLVTVEWNQYPVNYPENSLTGVSWRNGGYVGLPNFLPTKLGYGGYAAYNTFNWIFQGTNLNDGDIFGNKDAIVGNETDGCLYKWENGIPKVTGIDKTPQNFTILGISPAADPNDCSTNGRQAIMGLYYTPSGGAVFNASSLNWVLGLDSNAIVQRITKNIFNRFLSNKFPPEILSWGPYKVFPDSINNELIYLNKRIATVPLGKSKIFSIKTNNLFNGPTKYVWTENGKIKSTDSIFNYIPDIINNNYKDIVKVYAINSHDTSVMKWDVFKRPIQIVSESTKNSSSFKGNFSYKIKAVGFYQDSLNLKIISAPTGFSLSQDGFLSGNISQPGNYTITVEAKDSLNNSEIQSFEIKVDGIISVYQSEEISSPSSFELFQNYPNPFNPSTTISYQLAEDSFVSLKVYDILGKEIKTLVNESKSAGKYTFNFDASDLASGVYFYRLQADNYYNVKKLLLMK